MPFTGNGRKTLKIVLILVSLVLLGSIALLVGTLFLVDSLDRPTGAVPENGLEFRVSSGDSAATIARHLQEAQAIRSADLFRLLVKFRGQEQNLKAGIYRIKPGLSGSETANLIVSGQQLLVRVSVPEGSGLQTLAMAAELAGVASAASVIEAVYDQDFIDSLGIPASSLIGYLFPDTYLLPQEAGARTLLKLMVDTFRKRLAENLPEAASLVPGDIHARIIMASIVEREYRVAEEAPLMAGVFWNRLRIGMALQSCATVVYAITENLGKPHPSRLFDRDLRINDPFNTYMFPGLPPAPICNPGLTAIMAAFRPVSTRYLYFRLLDEAKGSHYFSETLDEHIKAGALFVKPKGS
jgi:UPF0755 protein